MKGFVTVILFFLFALAFAGTEYVDAVPAASMTVCYCTAYGYYSAALHQ